jgi:4'-phosphopantetheinyl transferase
LAQLHRGHEGLHFNVSRSDDTCLIAVASNAVGIDVERPDGRGIDLDAFARRFFAPNERAALRQLVGRPKLLTFFRLWTLKEAFVKALGGGLNIPLDAFGVSASDELPRLTTYRGGDVDAWTLASPPIDDRLIAAVALRRPSDWEGLSFVVRDVEPRWQTPAVRARLTGGTPRR